MEWKEVRLGDSSVCFIDGDRGKNYPKGNEFSPTGYCLFLNAGNVTKKGFVFQDNAFISREKDESLRKGKLQYGDLVLTTRGTVGNVAYYNKDVRYAHIRINSGMVIVRHDEDFDTEFLYHYLRSSLFQNQIKQFQSGSAQPQLPISTLNKMVVLQPPISTQRRIASILSSLDRKIELNNKINAQLEEMAQAIFKSWFVDFEPFKDGKFVESELGMIPEGWRVGTLTEIANYVNGLAMQKFPPANEKDSLPVLKIKELGQGQTDSSSDRCSLDIKPDYIINDGDVIFSWSGTLIVDIWCGGKCGLNQHLFKVTSNEYPKWFYLYWTKHHLDKFIRIAKDKAVTMGHIKRGELDASLVAIPDATSMKTIDSQMAPIVNLLIANRITNRTLSQLRDTLLPKLMSGEIDLDEIEKTI